MDETKHGPTRLQGPAPAARSSPRTRTQALMELWAMPLSRLSCPLSPLCRTKTHPLTGFGGTGSKQLRVNTSQHVASVSGRKTKGTVTRRLLPRSTQHLTPNVNSKRCRNRDRQVWWWAGQGPCNLVRWSDSKTPAVRAAGFPAGFTEVPGNP